MKKSILLLSAVAAIAFASCEKKTSTTETTVEPTTDTVIVKETETPAPDTVVKAETDGTSVSVSSDGVNVSSKDGDKKTTVDVNAKK
jgi:hypothetical protein